MMSAINSWVIWALSIVVFVFGIVYGNDIMPALLVVALMGSLVSMALWDFNKRLCALEEDAAKERLASTHS